MTTLTVELAERSYPISIEPGLLASPDSAMLIGHGGALIVTDENVGPLYAGQIKQRINRPDCAVWQMPAGEQEKNLSRFSELIDSLAAQKFTRDGTVIALGGGVIGDLAGFAAACYMRGIAFIQVPTSLLAMVDSSVGGKTAVDLSAGKNLVGAFHQPIAVWIDPDVLNTLPDREYKAGMAEVIKYGAIADPDFFAWLEQNHSALMAKQPQCLEQAIARSCQHKADIVARDETEQGDRALLNFGHTFGHALEVLLDYSALVHGEAVAIGMLWAAEFSAELGLADRQDTERLKNLLQAYGLPIAPPSRLQAEHILDKMRLDKKARHGELRLILWRGIGQAFIAQDVDAGALLRFLQAKTGA